MFQFLQQTKTHQTRGGSAHEHTIFKWLVSGAYTRILKRFLTSSEKWVMVRLDRAEEQTDDSIPDEPTSHVPLETQPAVSQEFPSAR